MLRQLNPETGAWLSDYLQGVSNHEISELLASTTTVLWVMDDDQQIFFALEEVRNIDDDTLVFAYPKTGVKLPDGLKKFGHPSLLPPVAQATPTPREKWARCGGDIRYDNTLGLQNPWMLTFQSGRYGTRDHLKDSHIEAVAGLFAKNSVLLTPYV